MTQPNGFGSGRLVPFADSIWTATSPVRFIGTWFPHVMTVVKLASGGVLLHSPCRLSPAHLASIADLGRVTDVVAPNWFHDLFLDDYRSAYPEATFWGPAFLRVQHAPLIDRVFSVTERPPWFDEVPYVAVPGLVTFDEHIFLHVRTRTLIVADMLMNAVPPDDAPLFTRLAYRILGLDGTLKTFAVLRWFAWLNKKALYRAAQQIREWNPERLIVGHGEAVERQTREQLRAALAWLKP